MVWNGKKIPVDAWYNYITSVRCTGLRTSFPILLITQKWQHILLWNLILSSHSVISEFIFPQSVPYLATQGTSRNSIHYEISTKYNTRHAKIETLASKLIMAASMRESPEQLTMLVFFHCVEAHMQQDGHRSPARPAESVQIFTLQASFSSLCKVGLFITIIRQESLKRKNFNVNWNLQHN